MIVTVNSFGVTLRKKDDCIEAESKESRQYFTPEQYDLVEPFRAGIEQTVCKLFTKRQVHLPEHFQQDGAGLFLSGAGKKLLTAAIYDSGGNQDKMLRLVTELAKGLNCWTAS